MFGAHEMILDSRCVIGSQDRILFDYKRPSEKLGLIANLQNSGSESWCNAKLEVPAFVRSVKRSNEIHS